MSSNGSFNVQFIDLSQSTAESRRQAHSHAARAAHARARRLRIIKHQHDASAGSTDTAPWLPSPVDLLGSHRRDPFMSLAGPLKPIEHFLLDHYISAVIPRMRICCKIIRGGPVSYAQFMAEEWMELAQSDTGLMNGIFLSACRHLSDEHHQQEFYTRLAVQYKIGCVRAVSEAISATISSNFGDSTVATTMLLALDEFSVGNLTISRQHVHGAVKMVEHNGGPQTLGLSGFLESALHAIISDTSPL